MFVFSLNKSGMWITLILQLLCLSLCPSYGRPSFDEDDVVPYEDLEEQEEYQVDDMHDSEDEDDNDEENDNTTSTSTPTPKGLEKCLGKKGNELKACLAVEGVSAATKVATGSSPQELVASKVTKFIPGLKDEYDD